MKHQVDRVGVSADDIKALEGVVRARSSAHYISKADVEDIASTIWLESVGARARGSQAPLNKYAMLLAQKARYYQRAADGNAQRWPEYSAGRSDHGAFDPADARQRFGLSIEVRDVLGRLPRHLREVLVLCDMEGLTLHQAAVHLGVSVATAHRRRTLGREAFRVAWTA